MIDNRDMTYPNIVHSVCIHFVTWLFGAGGLSFPTVIGIPRGLPGHNRTITFSHDGPQTTKIHILCTGNKNHIVRSETFAAAVPPDTEVSVVLPFDTNQVLKCIFKSEEIEETKLTLKIASCKESNI